MPILSEHNGYTNWLENKFDISEDFANYIVSLSGFKTVLSYYETKRSNKKFDKFRDWVAQQDLEDLKKSFKENKKKNNIKRHQQRLNQIMFVKESGFLEEFDKYEKAELRKKHKNWSRKKFNNYYNIAWIIESGGNLYRHFKLDEKIIKELWKKK